jgi:hypothetical protein
MFKRIRTDLMNDEDDEPLKAMSRSTRHRGAASRAAATSSRGQSLSGAQKRRNDAVQPKRPLARAATPRSL